MFERLVDDLNLVSCSASSKLHMLRRPASLTSLEKRVGCQEMSSVMSPDNSTVAVGVVDVAVVSVSDGISGVTADVRCWLGLAWTSTS